MLTNILHDVVQIQKSRCLFSFSISSLLRAGVWYVQITMLMSIISGSSMSVLHPAAFTSTNGAAAASVSTSSSLPLSSGNSNSKNFSCLFPPWPLNVFPSKSFLTPCAELLPHQWGCSSSVCSLLLTSCLHQDFSTSCRKRSCKMISLSGSTSSRHTVLCMELADGADIV